MIGTSIVVTNWFTGKVTKKDGTSIFHFFQVIIGIVHSNFQMFWRNQVHEFKHSICIIGNNNSTVIFDRWTSNRLTWQKLELTFNLTFNCISQGLRICYQNGACTCIVLCLRQEIGCHIGWISATISNTTDF